MWRTILNKLGSYKADLLLLALNVLLWVNLDKVLLWIDSTSAVPSGEYLAKFVFATFGVFAAHFIVKLIMLIAWRTLDRHLEADFNTTFQRLNSWQKLKTSLFIFSLYFSLWALLVAAM